MKALAGLLVAASVAFCIFSIAQGNSYGRLRQDYSRAYNYPNKEQIQSRVETSQGELLSTVKVVSSLYYLLSLGFFVGVLKTTPRRTGPIIGIVICVVMLGWTLILSRAASFDEVYPGWVAAAILLAILQLVTFGSAAKRDTPRP